MFLLLSALIGLALLSAIGLATLSRLRRRSYRRVWLGLGSVALVLGVLWVDRAAFPFMDDGPFVGGKCTSMPSRAPDQIFEVMPGRLEVFDATESQDTPIVLRRGTDGQVAWCIATIGDPGTSARRVRFSSVRPGPLGFVVDGLVEWTFGAEHTRWMFWWTGGLRSYWFSW